MSLYFKKIAKRSCPLDKFPPTFSPDQESTYNYKDVTVSMLGTLVVTILVQGRGIHETRNNVNFRMDLLTQFQLVDVLA